MNRLIDLSIHSWRVVLMMLIFLLVAGMAAYVNVPKESSPDVQVPIIYVSMYLEGISPEDAERLLIRPMEKELRSIDRVKKMSAEATEGFASVTLEFEAGFDPDAALADVRDAVDMAKPELPADAEEPVVQEVNFSQFPVINVVLSGDTDQRVLVTIARDLRDKFEGLGSVLEAQIAGEREEMLEILIDPLALESYRINPADVLQKVQNNNILVAAGRLDNDNGRFRIKLPGLIEKAEDLYTIPIITTPEKVVVLKDIAEVRRTFKDAESYARINGKPAIGIGVSKRAGANIIDTVEAVKQLVEEERRYWPPAIEVSYSQDTSGEIRDMLSDLENNVLFALLLVMISVLLTMDMRSSLLVALSVPGSFLIGVLFISMMGYTMNIVVLFSLILSSGMVVDATIVVCEYADRLIREGGVRPAVAYARAAKRMALPVISATLCTLVVFMPLLFWPGIVGQFMKYMPITLIVVLAGSLLMALIFIPSVGSRFGYKKQYLPQLSQEEIPSGLEDEREIPSSHPFTLRYIALLEKILSRPRTTIASVMGGVTLIFILFPLIGPGVEFFPDIDPKNANILVKSVGNLSLSEKDAIVREVEERLQPLEKEIRFFYAQSGATTLRGAGQDVIGLVQLEFVNWRNRRPVDEILEDARQRLGDIPGVFIEAAKQEEGPQSGKPLELEFASRFPDKLEPAVSQFLTQIESVKGLVDVEDDRSKPGIEWEYVVDRVEAGRNNISVAAIGQVVKFITNGVKVNEYRPDDADDELDIIVRFPEHYRHLEQLAALRVLAEGGVLEPVSNFITREARQAVNAIRRVDGMRVITVKADVEENILPDDKVKEITGILQQSPPDAAVSVTFRGEDEDQKEAMQFLSVAFMVALFLMIVGLTAQFNSFYSMMIIMSAVFLSTGGVLFGSLIMYQPFGIVMSGVGVITLAGVIVNNNIILIDTYNILRRQGMAVKEALLLSCSVRLRPILLTAGTTVLGLIPMMFGLNIDFIHRDVTIGAPSSQWWTQLSTAIAGGLTFATVLTLFVTPAMLLMQDRRKA